MSRIASLSAGSTTLVRATSGTLFEVYIPSPPAGASVYVADISDAGTAGPNFSLTSTTAGSNWSVRGPIYGASAGPDTIDFKGLQFSRLTVSATSSATVHVITD